MTGGPSQIDTFDLKPGHANGGPFKAIETAVPGILISEHLPKLARQMKDLAIIRSMSTKEGDHGRATFYLRTGYLPHGPIRYPTLGSLVAKELERRRRPSCPTSSASRPSASFNPAAFGPGFLGPQYAPLVVGERRRGRPQGGTTLRAVAQGRGPGPARRASTARGPTPGSACSTRSDSDFLAEPSRASRP